MRPRTLPGLHRHLKNSRITAITRYGTAGFEQHHRPAGSVMVVAFQLDIRRRFGGRFGLNAWVERPGEVKVGDRVELLDPLNPRSVQ